MNTVVYLTSKSNSAKFDWLEEKYILNKQLKDGLDEEAFINCVKIDLRNTAVDYLIVDIMILKNQVPKDVLAGLETFNLLSSSSKIMLYFPQEWEVKESIDILQKYYKYYIIDDLSPIQSQFEALVDVPVDEIEEGGNKVEIVSDEIASTEEGGDFQEQEEVQVIEEHNEPKIQEEKRLTDENVPVDIFERTNQKIKTHEGQPLGKRCAEQQKERKETKAKNIVKIGSEIWNCSNIVIVVAGTDRRTGTTTAAIHLCKCLNEHGAKVCYSEAVLEGHKHLQYIAEECDFVKEEDCYQKENINFYTDSVYDTNAGYNFIILDVGAVPERPKWVASVLDEIAQEVLLIATGAWEYERIKLDESLAQLSGLEKRMNVVINSSTNENYQRIEQQYGKKVLVHQGVFEPTFFTSTRADNEIADLLQQYNK